MRRDHSSAEKDANTRLQQQCHVHADICGELEDRRTHVNVRKTRKTRKTTSSRAKSQCEATSLASPGAPATVAAPCGQWQLVQASDRPQRCAMVATHRKDHGKNPRHMTRMLHDGHTTRVPPALCGHEGDDGDDNGRRRPVENVGQQQAAAGMATARQQ
ncbi:hypothetical protein EDB83DRAFT_2324153 [Lactarius deliciosus]|nr:hypothetical protein EDB83DRAFT_2324153 [Lactarius deliciosus]